jgi:O-antigen/teichoic acid export membrane protein
MGAVVGYLGVAAFAGVLFRVVPGYFELSDAVLSLALGAVLGALYWAICIRKERAQRKAREIEQAAIRAME